MGETRMIPLDKTNVRGYKEPTLKCTKCQSEWFMKIAVNNFRNTPIDLHNGQKEMVMEDRVSLLECLGCGNIQLPVTSYVYLQGKDKYVAERIQDLLDKRQIKDETNIPKG
jgi:Zn ribbon nucleic-acid-binding protein